MQITARGGIGNDGWNVGSSYRVGKQDRRIDCAHRRDRGGGAFSAAQAELWTVYTTESSGLTGWVRSDTPNDFTQSAIGVGDTPMFLAANPSGTRVYVPNRFGIVPTAPSRAGVGTRTVSFGVGNVSVIDTATKTVIATIEDPSFDEPVAVAVKPDGSEAWVVNNFSGTVSIIDTATNLVTGTIR